MYIICKNIQGAAERESMILLSLFAPRAKGTVSARLIVREENGSEREYEAHWQRREREYDVYESPLKTGKPGLLWYRFSVEMAEKIEETGEKQITVFEPSPSPEWFSEGVCYQIFPDRFCRKGGFLAQKGVLRQDWGGAPLKNDLNNEFFGGNLSGIESKLDYLRSLSVNTIYLNPIFASPSNHRYDTESYERVDEMLGDEDAFVSLCEAAHARGMHVLLDGVFSHTGDKNPRFLAARGDASSPYRAWYKFDEKGAYSSWWGIKTLPETDETNAEFREYIFNIARKWLRLGADGWRLDVADELPDEFIFDLAAACREEKPDCLLIGEVWEDASCKISYGLRRRYILGRGLNGVTNYPFRTAILDLLRGGSPEAFREAVETISSNYPPRVLASCMTILGTHDTPRALTALSEPDKSSSIRQKNASNYVKNDEAKRLLLLASALQYALPGVPTVFYGDEAGLRGGGDPYCRACFPWGREDAELTEHYRRLGRLRAASAALRLGTTRFTRAQGGFVEFIREYRGETAVCTVNLIDKSIRIKV